MENKKNKEADMEQNRSSFFLVGLNYILALTLASFTFQMPDVKKDLGDLNQKPTKQQPTQQKPDKKTPEIIEVPQVNLNPPPSENILVLVNSDTIVKSGVSVTPLVIFGDTTIMNEPEIIEEIIEFPDVEAEFVGGAQAMSKYIQTNIIYPPTSIEMNEQGKVFLSFVVETDGSISNVSIERGVSDDLDREAKRIVRSMPKWTPGESKAKKIRARCRLPINFQIN